MAEVLVTAEMLDSAMLARYKGNIQPEMSFKFINTHTITMCFAQYDEETKFIYFNRRIVSLDVLLHNFK